MKLLFMLVGLIISSLGYSQKIMKVIEYDCPDSLGFITNQRGIDRNVSFFVDPNDSPTFYFIENFTHKDFAKLIQENDVKVLSRVKLVKLGYVAKPYDFLYAYNAKKELLFYYILKDRQEEKLLVQ